MKSKICIIMVVALAASLLTTTATIAGNGLELLPIDAQGVLTIASIEKLYKTFGLEELRAEYPEQFQEMREEMLDDLGVDLLDLNALREFGLEPGKPIHMGIVVDPEFAMAVVLPAAGDAASFVKAILEQDEAEFSQKVKAHGVEIYGDDDDGAALFAKDGFAVLVFTDEDETGVSALEAAQNLLAALEKGTMAQSKDYKKALKKIPGDGDFTIYMGPKFYDKMMDLQHDEELEEQGVSVEEVKELYEEWGISGITAVVEAVLESDRLVVESYSWMNKDSEILDRYRVTNDPTKFLEGVPSDPMLALVSRVNFQKIWESINEIDDVIESDSIPDFDDALDDASEEIGVDIEKALISQFNGNLALIISQVQMMNSDAVLLAQVTRPEEFRATLIEAVEALDEAFEVNPSEDSGQPNPELERAEFEGVPYYVYKVPPMLEVCFGVIKDHLVVTTSRVRFQSIVSGGPGFADNIGNAEISKALAERTGNVFYLDFQKLARDLQAWAPMLGEESFEMVELLMNMKDLVSVSRMDKDGGVWQKMTLTGAKPDVWKRLLAAGIEEIPEDVEIEIDDDDQTTDG